MSEISSVKPHASSSHENDRNQNQALGTGLGWFSIGLGLAELLAPRSVARWIGSDEDGKSVGLLRVYGLREIAAGVGILASSNRAGWLWGRVAGDALDLVSLGSAMTSNGSNRGRLAGATAAVAGIAALDVVAAQQLSQRGKGLSSQPKVRAAASITVNQSPEQVYAFWRDFTNIARFARHIESVRISSDTHSHWTAITPGGSRMEWDAEIIDDQPNSRIAWRSIGDADFPHAGAVSFKPAPGNRGTMIHLEIQFVPPGGLLVAKLAKVFGSDPAGQVSRDLHSCKQVIETGDIMRSDASIHSGAHPAQPPELAPPNSDAGMEAQASLS